MPSEVTHELHWALLRGVLHEAGVPDDCDECRGFYGCDVATVLTVDGDVVRVDDMPGVVSWPQCPMRYARARETGGDLLTLDAALRWLVARGVHRHPALGAGAASLYREYLSQRRLGRTMIRVRHAAEAERQRGRR